MSYKRVIPRDFFNEAKILKCLGLLSVKILDGELYDYDASDYLTQDDRFTIERYDDGSLYCANYRVRIGSVFVFFFTTQNSKAEYPLLFTDTRNDGEQYVFNSVGEFTTDFIDYCKHCNE